MIGGFMNYKKNKIIGRSDIRYFYLQIREIHRRAGLFFD